MDRREWFQPKWLWLKRLALAAAAGLALLVIGVLVNSPIWFGFAAVSALPLLVWLVLIPVLHWKDRYIGQRSAAWGAFLVLETTGWSKIVYWFRHVLPDWRKSGRYRDAS